MAGCQMRSAAAAMFIFIAAGSSAAPWRYSRMLQEGQQQQGKEGKSSPALTSQSAMGPELTQLYSDLDNLRVSDVQDVDFASTLYVLEEHEIKLAKWHLTHGQHAKLLNLTKQILQSRQNETQELKEFLQKRDAQNPFAVLDRSNGVFFGAVPVKTDTLGTISVPLKGFENPLASAKGMPLGKIALKSNVLMSASRAGFAREDGAETAAVRYQNRQKGRPAGSVLAGSVHGIPLAGDPDSDYATIMIIQHQGVVQAARAEVAKGGDSQMQDLAKAVLERAEAELAVLRAVLRELMEAHFNSKRAQTTAASPVAKPAQAPSV